MFRRDEFEAEKLKKAMAMANDGALQQQALDFVVAADKHDYAYQWTWLGLPMIQLPADIVLTQEVIWQNKPDIIIETGIAWGGSVAFYGSLLQMIGQGEIVAVDLNLYDHVRDQIMSYPFSNRIHLYKGSSTDSSIVERIKSHIKSGQKVMVLLDSNHTHDHVLAELRLFAPLVTKGQFLVVSDTIIEHIPAHPERKRPWGAGNSPASALNQYLGETDRFEIDAYANAKVLTTFTPRGYVRCIK